MTELNANTTTTGGDPAVTENQQVGETPVSWEQYLSAQPEHIRALYATHAEGLMNTIRATRTERDALSKQIKDLAAKTEEGSDARKQLDEMSAKLEATERRAAFLEDAMRPEVQCRNAKAAWLLAQAGELFDKRGHPDWAAIRAEAPELFGAPTTNGTAGTGTGTQPPTRKNMNDFIRAAAGRR